MPDRVRAICYPRDDEGFIARVQELLEEPVEPDERLRAAVQALLRETYPLVVVSSRHPFAALDDRPTWYVYRDGGVPAIWTD